MTAPSSSICSRATPSRSIPPRRFMGPDYAKWFASGGTQGKEPEDPNSSR